MSEQLLRTGSRERVVGSNSDYTTLATLIRSSQLMRRRPVYYGSRFAAILIALAGGIVLLVMLGDTWWQLLVAAALGILFGQAAFLGHDAAHQQIFASGKANRWASIVIGCLIVGMSYGWWQHKHTRHHANPNKLGVDPDVEVPVVAMSADRLARPRTRLVGWLVAHQGAFFFPILPMEGLSLHVSSVRRLVNREVMPNRSTEIVLLGARLIGFPVLVFLVLPLPVAGAFLGVQLAVFGFYMGATFAPNHKGMALVRAGDKMDFLRRQVLTSRNIRGGRFVDWAMGGLNYQIEHHLFPSMPSLHLRRAAPIVREHCRSLGLPYTQTSLLASYATVVRYLNRVGLGERDVFECPLVTQRRTG
jgi:fatty acid desaturase